MKTLYYVFLAALLAIVTGCGNNEGRMGVTGTVSLDGKPLEGAIVNLIPKSRDGGMRDAVATTDAQGKFTVRTLAGGTKDRTGVLPGEYSVTVSKIQTIDTGKKEPSKVMAGQMDPVLQEKELVPAIYITPDNSPLSIVVKAKGATDCEFKLTSK